MMKILLTLLSAVGLTHVSSQTISEIVAGNPDLSTLLQALQVTGLDQELSGTGPFTLFAPTNDAFQVLQNYSPGTLEGMLQQSPPDDLTQLLQYHVVDGTVTLDEITSGSVTSLTTLEGQNITLSATEPYLDGFSTIEQTIQADNGIVQIISAALAPASLSLPPGIAIAANETGQFSTLLGLVQAAGLAGQLNSAGPFTVFAPTDEAFAKIPNLDQITSDIQTVIAILTNHVVGGVYTSDLLSDGQVLKTIVNGDLTVSINGNSIMINDATVVTPDILGSNGVVHGIDTVLIPDLSNFDGNITSSSIEPSSAPGTLPPGNFPSPEGGGSAANLCSVSGVAALIIAALSIVFV